MSITSLPGLPIGSRAPDFTLKHAPSKEVSLSDFQGQPVVLMFYPADFSPVCENEVSLFNEVLPMLREHNARLLGISVDNVWSHLAFAKLTNARFLLLSDFHPKGSVSRSFNVYRPQEGESERAVFVIDEEGLVVWSHVSPPGINPGLDGVLLALEGLSSRQN